MSESDLDLALHLLDLADRESTRRWTEAGTTAATKSDGTPVTEADIAAEVAIRDALRRARPDDGFLGEEVGETVGRSGRRWIADGIDGTRFFAAGEPTWGTLLALEDDGEIVLGVNSSPVQDRRWWATRGHGAFTGRCDGSQARRIHVSSSARTTPDRVVCLPGFDSLSPAQGDTLRHLAGGRPVDRPWSHQNLVAEGAADLCVWFAGAIWDHAAPSIIVREAGGRFSDHSGGTRLDTRTAVYSNGIVHDGALAALRAHGAGPRRNSVAVDGGGI